MILELPKKNEFVNKVAVPLGVTVIVLNAAGESECHPCPFLLL